LNIIFGLKMQEVEGGWRRLHTEESHNLYDEMGRPYGTHGGDEKCVQNFGWIT
jgi:hypothetical protein